MTPAVSIALSISAWLGIFALAFAWGLWTLKPWAFWAVVIVEAARVILALYTLFFLQRILVSSLLGLVLPLIILVYLFADSRVRAAFRPASEQMSIEVDADPPGVDRR